MEQGNCFTIIGVVLDVLDLALCILGNSFTCNNCQRSRQFMNTMKATVWGGMGPVTDGPSIKVSEEGATWNRWISSVDIIPRSSQLRHRAQLTVKLQTRLLLESPTGLTIYDASGHHKTTHYL